MQSDRFDDWRDEEPGRLPGTVWAVEQATILFGLCRFGFDARALDLTRALFDLAQLYTKHRIPECIGGYPRSDAMPGAYPRANTPQLWNATSFPLVMQILLGSRPLPRSTRSSLIRCFPSGCPR